ncbi:MAG: ABC transporter substrate-binding protein [Eubacterium sp.]
MNKKIQRILLGVMTLIMSVALCACGGDKTDKQTTDKSQSNAASGGSVVVGITQDLDSLDPHSMAYAGTREVLFNVFEGLVKADSNGDLIPAVASDYTVSDDADIYTFTIRDGITFHDGSEVTAEDIKYSVERYADIQGESSAFSILKEVNIVDEQTIEIILTEGSTEFLAQLTCAIMPESNDADVNKNPIGTGPFKYVSYKAGQSFVIEKYNGYWGTQAYLDEVTFKMVADSDTALMELQAGTIDIYQYLTTDQAAALTSGFDIYEGSVNYVQALFLNNNYEPFTDKGVRQALCYAIDRNEIINFLFDGKSHIIGTNMIPAFKKYYNEETEDVYSYNVDKAKELLREAGYEDGFELTITVPNNYAPHQSAAEIIVEQLKKVGITANIELVEFTTWYNDVYVNRDYEATVVAVDGTLAPGSYFEKNVSTSSVNFTNYSNEEFDTVYQQALATTDDSEKIELYKQLQMILAEDAASVYIEDPANLVAVNSKLGGYTFYPVAAQDMSLVYYKE